MLRSEICQRPWVEQALADSPYDPELGARLLTITTTVIAGEDVSAIIVRLDPRRAVEAHMHEHGGEICTALTDVIGVLGEPQRRPDGGYLTDREGKIIVDWNAPVELKAGDYIEIPEGKAHYLFNHSPDVCADIHFFIPNKHFLADVNGSLDKKLTDNPHNLLVGTVP